MPKKFNKTLASRMCALANKGMMIEAIAKTVGVNRSTLLRWLKDGRDGKEEFADFAISFDAAQAFFEELILDDLLVNGSPKDKMNLLARRNPKDWASTQRQEVIIHNERTKLIDFLQKYLSADAFEEVLTALEEYSEELEGA